MEKESKILLKVEKLGTVVVVISALARWRQGGQEFKFIPSYLEFRTSLGYIRFSPVPSKMNI